MMSMLIMMMMVTVVGGDGGDGGDGGGGGRSSCGAAECEACSQYVSDWAMKCQLFWIADGFGVGLVFQRSVLQLRCLGYAVPILLG